MVKFGQYKAKKERLCRVFLSLGWVLSLWCVTLGVQKRLLITELKELWVLLKTYLRSQSVPHPVLVRTL